jgi:hypothetical protein
MEKEMKKVKNFNGKVQMAKFHLKFKNDVNPIYTFQIWACGTRNNSSRNA